MEETCQSIFGEDNFFIHCQLDPDHHGPHMASMVSKQQPDEKTILSMEGYLIWIEVQEVP